MNTESVYIVTGIWREEKFIEAYIAMDAAGAKQLAILHSGEMDPEAPTVEVLSVVDTGIKVSG